MQERLFAAIMFTDIVGFTALMGQDEDDTLSLLRHNHKIQKSAIEKYHGDFVKEIGDGILAYFDNADEAVLCSIEIQQKLKNTSDANVRIGIHWAEIILEDDDIYGDGVNIASRIETLSDPGGIFVSEAVINSLKSEGKISSKYLGSTKLKNVRKPIIIYAITDDELPPPSIKRFNALANPKKKIPVLPTILAFLVIVSIALIIVNRLNNRANIIQAEGSLDKIETLINLNWSNYSEAYYLAKEAELIIPKNPRLKQFIDETSININITTDPPGAEIFYKLYDQPDNEWQSLGITPIDSIQVPISVFRWKIEKEGYDTVMAASLTFMFKNITNMKMSNMYTGKDFHRVLDLEGNIPIDMTRVKGEEMPYGKIDDFFIDKYEVSNQKYKTFVDQGGYLNQDYWKELIISLNDSIKWEEAMQYFVDQSGQPGPSTWNNQNYPEGEESHPVAGISWFEANAYAQFTGKSIPTKDHWGLARGEGTFLVAIPQLGGNAIFAPFSNFNGDEPVETGSFPGLTSYGSYDMAGNVREWCWNESIQGRWIRGGAWNDNPYMFGGASQANPFDRDERNGFRCALYPNLNSIPEEAMTMMEYDAHKMKLKISDPISNEQFEMYKSYYDYDRIDLNDEIVSKTENDKGWVLEKVEFDAAYDDERVTAYLFLPTNTSPPYQTVIYGPGSNVLRQENSTDIENFFEFSAFLEFWVKNGRAVVFPVIKGSFERRGETSPFANSGTHQFTSYITRVIKDYRRCLDYLETREDFDMDKVVFYGMSMGPIFGTYLSAVETRIKANIFYAGGLNRVDRPEANRVYFLRRITAPTLMINGKYDSLFGIEAIMNMYDLLGTPEKDKKLVLLDSDHLAPQEDLISESLFWLDEQFGEVDYSIQIQRI